MKGADLIPSHLAITPAFLRVFCVCVCDSLSVGAWPVLVKSSGGLTVRSDLSGGK